MLISCIFDYSESFFVVFYLSFYFVLGQDPSARDTHRASFFYRTFVSSALMFAL